MGHTDSSLTQWQLFSTAKVIFHHVTVALIVPRSSVRAHCTHAQKHWY